MKEKAKEFFLQGKFSESLRSCVNKGNAYNQPLTKLTASGTESGCLDLVCTWHVRQIMQQKLLKGHLQINDVFSRLGFHINRMFD